MKWTRKYNTGRTTPDGRINFTDRVDTIEHVSDGNSHCLIVNGMVGYSSPYDQIAMNGDYYASTDAHTNLPELFTISTFGLEKA